MIILAKCALALTGTIVAAGVYTFHEGVIKVDVDEHLRLRTRRKIDDHPR